MEVGLKKEAVARAEFGRSELLRWLYVGRMTLAAGILASILGAWESASPQASRIATLMFLAALEVTLGSAWHTHFRGRPVGQNFLYTHVILDVALVTTIVHITTVGDEVVFAPLYILVITEGALLLPLPGGVLIGALAAIVYFADLPIWSGVIPRSRSPEPSASRSVSSLVWRLSRDGWVTGCVEPVSTSVRCRRNWPVFNSTRETF